MSLPTQQRPASHWALFELTRDDAATDELVSVGDVTLEVDRTASARFRRNTGGTLESAASLSAQLALAIPTLSLFKVMA